jgi:hypothetical protein
MIVLIDTARFEEVSKISQNSEMNRELGSGAKTLSYDAM